MAQRRTNGTSSRLRKTESIKSNGGDDFDFLAASQGSTGSDDHALQLAVAQQLMGSLSASKEKKRKDHERKFLQASKSKLENQLHGDAETAVAAVTELNEAYANFFAEYIASEDVIRAIWVELKDTIAKHHALVGKLRKKGEALRAATEAAQIDGMGSVKGACQEHRALVNSLDSAGAA
ncbi:hypothetical protein HMN09_00820100 [Mycena chlorophos]|uniref:Uncharacterized protein n=1 Tax=Mycena chlorophos TaxID=658473 RepID=A0A8H6WAU4_MYCCL|nr:hypothetical protein HMN09_00820100 [Mycena chlorophos]